jgi:lysozyme family protein
LGKGKPVVIGVDRTGDSRTDHWMTVTGKNADGSYRVNDPAGGKTITMEMRNGKLVSRDVPGKTYTFTGDAVYFSGGNRKTGQGATTPTQKQTETQQKAQTQKQTETQKQTQTTLAKPRTGHEKYVVAAYADNSRKVENAKLSTDPRYAVDLKAITNLSPEKRKLIDEIAGKADLPPAVVAAIWYREASLKEGVYLHNGQPLGQTTTIKPKGIFFRKDQFVEAAVDALRSHRSDQKTLGLHYDSSDLGAMATYAEAYNGFGYRKNGVASPYAFAGTDQYKGGIYVKDGVFKRDVYDKRLGVMAVALQYSKKHEETADAVRIEAEGMKIDFKFISSLEGGQNLTVNVPDPKKSKSGVTIATGFDLGARSVADLVALGLSQALINKLSKYLGKKREEAEDFLRKNPLRISEAEADAIDRAAEKESVTRLMASYNKAVKGRPGLVRFEHLPAAVQTVIASVAFQYGDLGSRTPRFWNTVTQQQWQDAIHELRHFGDRYRTRRNTEADLLETVLKGGNSTKSGSTKARPSVPHGPRNQPSHPPGRESAKPETGPNFREIARNVHDAMFNNSTILGVKNTDEDKVYDNLAKLNHDEAIIKQFKNTYKGMYGQDIETHIKSEFSNTLLFGPERDRALSYLKPKSTQVPNPVLISRAGTPSGAKEVTAYHKGKKSTITVVPVGNGQYLRADAAKNFLAMQSAAQRAGIKLTATSGFRSMEEQRELYQKYLKGTGNLAAKPGYSNHQGGISMDIGGVGSYGTKAYKWLKNNASKYGFEDDVRREYWHWTYKGDGIA